MFVNPIGGTTQVNFQEAAANAQPPPNLAQNSSAIPEDTVTLSRAAQALQNEQSQGQPRVNSMEAAGSITPMKYLRRRPPR